MSKHKPKLGIYALHPIMYQTPIFGCLYKRIEKMEMESIVLYGDDISLREVYYEETNVTFKPDSPFLLDGYRYKLLKNYSKDSRSGFLSRINWGIIGEIITGRYDAILVHGFDRFTSFLIIFAAKITRTKLIWRGENIVKQKHIQKDIKSRIKYKLIKFLFNRFDAVLYSCTGNLNYLKYYTVPSKKLFPIPCAVNNSFFHGEKDRLIGNRDSIRRELQIKAKDFVVIFPARFTERKRPFDLIDSVSKMNGDNNVILFVGDGPEKLKMEEYAKGLNVNCIFTGFMNQSQISKYYVAADVGAVVSREDPSPKAMNEMMNFHLPIIVTDVVGTAYDLVKDGINGYIVKVGAIDDITEKLQLIKDNDKLKYEMGVSSTKIVDNWNYDKDVDGILSAFKFVTGFKL